MVSKVGALVYMYLFIVRSIEMHWQCIYMFLFLGGGEMKIWCTSHVSGTFNKCLLVGSFLRSFIMFMEWLVGMAVQLDKNVAKNTWLTWFLPHNGCLIIFMNGLKQLSPIVGRNRPNRLLPFQWARASYDIASDIL